MAQPATNPKLDEFRLKLKADPKSRLFFPMAEELRKGGQLQEAEQALRTGLANHPAYLSAWVSLGRILREQKKDADAVTALTTALTLDPGNVVAARLLADSYLALGNKVEAIKKYKLVHALLPSDEELEAQIEVLERDISSPQGTISVSEPEPEEDAPAFAPMAVSQEPVAESPFAAEPAVPALEESPFDKTVPPFADAANVTGEPAQDFAGSAESAFAPEESPFAEPVESFGQPPVEDVEDVEDEPAGMPMAAPLVPERAAPPVDDFSPPVPESMFAEEPAAAFGGEGVFAETAQPEPMVAQASIPALSEAAPADAAATVTMADLYARQGLVEDARHIYEDILTRDPANPDARAKLEAIAPQVNPRVARLEQWLARVGKREVGRV